MPGFPVSFLRDVDTFEKFCRTHLTEASTQVWDSWEFWFEAALPDDARVLRRFVPSEHSSPKFGPYPARDLINAHELLRTTADSLWTHVFQMHEAANIVFLRDTGMTSGTLGELYKWLWGTKDEPGSDFTALDDGLSAGYLEEVDYRLRTSYTLLARDAVGKGDDETAAQYIRVAFDLSLTEGVAEELSMEFAHLRERCEELAAVRENTVKKVATVAREGFAWWASLVWEEYYREGLITPVTDGIERSFSSGEMEAERQKIRRSSATNSYRRGLELMEQVQENLGFPTALLMELFTEWPLEEMRRRVPASTVVEQIRRGSPWAPDTRLERMAKFSRSDIRQVPFTGEVMPYLHTIHAHLDDALPGVMTYALRQLPDA